MRKQPFNKKRQISNRQKQFGGHSQRFFTVKNNEIQMTPQQIGMLLLGKENHHFQYDGPEAGSKSIASHQDPPKSSTVLFQPKQPTFFSGRLFFAALRTDHHLKSWKRIAQQVNAAIYTWPTEGSCARLGRENAGKHCSAALHKTTIRGFIQANQHYRQEAHPGQRKSRKKS